MAQLFKNNCASTLASGITDSALEMTLVDGSAFPAPGTDWYYVTLSLPDETDWEIVKVTAKATHVFTIVRGQESGSDARLAARAWDAGTRVSLRLTAGTVDTAISKLAGVEASATADQTAQEIATAIDADATAETTLKSALGLGTAAYTASTDYATAAKGVTNGDSHDHNGGDGGQIAYSALSGLPTLPSGAIVGTTDTQTLTNKTLTSPTLTGAVLNDGYTEEVFAVSGTTPALSPTNGTVQTWTLSGNSTPTAGTWAEGQSLLLMVLDGTAYTITWPTVTWVGGTAPTLDTTKYSCIELWKVGSTLYGALVGFA